MNTAKYSAEELARQAGIPVCLVRYYAQVGLLGEQDTLSTLSRGVRLGRYGCVCPGCATVVGFTYEEMACLLELNDGANSRVLRLAAKKWLSLLNSRGASHNYKCNSKYGFLNIVQNLIPPILFLSKD